MGGMEIIIFALVLGAMAFIAGLGRRIRSLEQTLNESASPSKGEVAALIAEKVKEFGDEIKETQRDEIASLADRVAEIERASAERIEAYTAQVDAQLKAAKDEIAPKTELEMLNEKCRAIEQRIAELDEAAAQLRAEVCSQADRATAENEKLQEQIRASISEDMANAFRRLDAALSSVLGEMKTDLLRGVNRIDKIQAARLTEKSEAASAGK